MSQIHYKFRSSKDYDSATFDGHSISVFDLKREILIAKGLKGPDDLALTHAESGEEYYDDATLIPKNTPILVARVPAKPGRGGAQRYLEGSGPIRGGGMTRNVFDRPGRSNTGGNSSYEAMGSKSYRNTTVPQSEPELAPPVDTSKLSEDEAMKLVLQQQATHWDKTQEGMASATYRPLAKFQAPTRLPTAGGPKPGTGTPVPAAVQAAPYQSSSLEQQQRPPPSTYVCHRCGKRGEHWIRFCPTNHDKSFEPIGIKKTTGIPRSFLKTVQSDVLESKKGYMVTQDGNLVVAQTNDSAWKKFHEMAKGTLSSEEAYSTAPVPDDMKCPICRLLLKSAVKAPCCGANFCDECIRTYLVSPPKGEESFKCQNCHMNLVPDQLMPNHDLRQKTEQHLREWAKGRLESETGGAIGSISRGGSPQSEEQRDTVKHDTLTSSIHANEAVGSAEAGTKRRPSVDHDASNQSDHDREAWKNKKQHVNGPNFNNNFNRNRPNAGPGGFMEGGAMLPDGLPPGFFEMMQQHDPGLFMDPTLFGANGGMAPFMMPGFIPPFGPTAGVPTPWGMGRGMPNLPPMGPGFPTPRIGFNDDRNGAHGPGPNAGRGRGRGGWQGNQASGRGASLERGPSAVNSTFNATSSNYDEGAKGPTDENVKENVAFRRRSSSPPRTSRASFSSGPTGRYDDDIDMSQVPTGPRGGMPSDEEDIPTGPKAGPDSRQRSITPPTAPLADRVRNRSVSQPRIERETSRIRDTISRDNYSREIGHRDREKDSGRDRTREMNNERESTEHRDRDRDRDRNRARDRSRDRENGRNRSKDRARNRYDESGRDHSRERSRHGRRGSSRERSAERSPHRAKENDRYRASRYDRDHTRNDDRDRERDNRIQRQDPKRDIKKDDRRDDTHYSTGSLADKQRSNSEHSRSDRDDSEHHFKRRSHSVRDHELEETQKSGHSPTVSQSSSRQRSLDPQREYELKRKASFGIAGREEPKNTKEDNDQILFRDRSSRTKAAVSSTANSAGSDRVLFRNQRGANEDLAVTGLISNSARERERRGRERKQGGNN
ncbi:E3 ubiquitin-protein ligase rbbp6 [Podila humilis]|nr:E3 ubiquitin-protein ligase rbbp6 [Podila humilis]